MEFLTVTIKTLSPVVLTAMNNAAVMTESRDFISGTMLRGILASRYIAEKGLGDGAHKDAEFRDLFFGGLCFVDAYPEKDGNRSFVIPLSLQKAKAPVKTGSSDETLADILYEEPKAGYKTVKGFGIAKGKCLEKVSVNKQVKLHMSRSGEQERLSGRSLEGGIYNYEAVETGQVFQGLIIGAKDKLERLLAALNVLDKPIDCRIGRSKYTEYGHCQLKFGTIEKSSVSNVQGKNLYLRLETPWIPLAGTVASATVLIRDFVEKVKTVLGAEDIKTGKVIAQSESIANFVGIWGLKRPEMQALSAGSVFSLYKETGWSASDLEKLDTMLTAGQGARTEEGFGQLRVWNMTGVVLQESNAAKPDRKKISSAKAKEIAANILMRKILNQVKLRAEQDVQQLKGDIASANHSFARLESLLGDRKNLDMAKKRFQDTLQEELRKQSVLDKKLQNLTLRGRELKEILTGKADMPYASLNFHDEVPPALAEDAGFTVPSAEHGTLFYEYWLWFFRHGRKFAIARKGDK